MQAQADAFGQMKDAGVSVRDLAGAYRVPKDWILMERTALLLLGLGAALAPGLNPLRVLAPYVEPLARSLGAGRLRGLRRTASRRASSASSRSPRRPRAPSSAWTAARCRCVPEIEARIGVRGGPRRGRGAGRRVGRAVGRRRGHRFAAHVHGDVALSIGLGIGAALGAIAALRR